MTQTPAMTAGRRIGPLVAAFYAAVPVLTYLLLRNSTKNMSMVGIDVLLSTIPMVLAAAVTWRVVWPKWKLAGKVILHPCIYAILSIYIGHWCILVAWIHQGVLGLGGHIWFSRKHGFTWYAVEDPERYVSLSKQAVDSLSSVDSASR